MTEVSGNEAGNLEAEDFTFDAEALKEFETSELIGTYAFLTSTLENIAEDSELFIEVNKGIDRLVEELDTRGVEDILETVFGIIDEL